MNNNKHEQNNKRYYFHTSWVTLLDLAERGKSVIMQKKSSISISSIDNNKNIAQGKV